MVLKNQNIGGKIKCAASPFNDLAGANGFDVSKLKEWLVEQMMKADISKAEDLTRQYIKDNPAIHLE